jgi:two-component system invasion response regulator UvrY
VKSPIHNPSAQLRVLLADAHTVVREGLRRVLEDEAHARVVAEAGEAEQALQAFRETRPDVVVMDLNLRGASGLEVIRRLRAWTRSVRVLVLTGQENEVLMRRAMKAGALGYLTKSCTVRDLVEGLARVARGETCSDMALARRAARAGQRRDGDPFAGLAAREFEVFRLLAAGYGHQAVADALSLSQKTVANYTSQIKRKLGVSSGAELARLAIRHGLIEP